MGVWGPTLTPPPFGKVSYAHFRRLHRPCPTMGDMLVGSVTYEREMVKSKALLIISPLAYDASIEARGPVLHCCDRSLPALECGLKARSLEW